MVPIGPAQLGSMWCPRCWAEYVLGTATCADCGGPLSGEMPPGLADKQRRADRRWSVAAAVALGVGVPALAFVASGVLYFLHSVCNVDAARFLAERRELRRDTTIVWTVACAIFLARSALGWRRGGRTWPWLAMSGAMLVLALREALFAEPTPWCVY